LIVCLSQILRVAQKALEGVNVIPKELRPQKSGPGAPVRQVECGTQVRAMQARACGAPSSGVRQGRISWWRHRA
jgi:hypothetical protein